MKHLLLSISLCLLLGSAFAQSRKDVRQYYYWINQAELAICDNNYERASDCYHTAFTFKRACIRDAHFAFQLNSTYLYNLDRACEAFHFLAQAGTKAYFKDGTPYLEDTTSHPDLWQSLKTISDTTLSLVNEDLYKALKEIARDDQNARMTCSIAGAIIDHTDSLNYQKTRQLFQQYKDIDEYTSGGAAMMTASFIHFAQLRLTTPDVFYEKMVKKGKLSATNYMQNFDYCYHCVFTCDNKTTYGTDPSYTYVINNTFFIRYPDNVKQINKNRMKLNVAETWEDYVKKVMYVYHSDSPFRFYPLQMMFYGGQDIQEQMEKDERARYDSGELKGAYYIKEKK